MRAAALVLFSLLLPSAAQQKAAAPLAVQVRPVPDEAVHQNARLAASLSPSAKAKVRSAAASLAVAAKQQPAMTVAQMQAMARTSVMRAFPNLAGMDIDAVVFVVMMQCAQDQQTELQQAMNQVQQNMQAKQAARQQNDVSEMQSMQLQMLMDQRSKLLQAISNEMKSAANTQSAIVANLK